ncbi:MAG: hypothetical protein M0Z42_23905, partial [Actinomycetota bacterium]|nr:hypothetical protein [Actinomycetota bacterium]
MTKHIPLPGGPQEGAVLNDHRAPFHDTVIAGALGTLSERHRFATMGLLVLAHAVGGPVGASATFDECPGPLAIAPAAHLPRRRGWRRHRVVFFSPLPFSPAVPIGAAAPSMRRASPAPCAPRNRARRPRPPPT